VIPLACRFAVVEPQRLSGKEPLVAFVGRLQDRKQPLVAAGAFRRIAARNPAWRFAVAGADGTCADGTSIQQACRETLGPFARRTEFLGPLNEEGLAQLFARSSICLVPSTFESFGLVALEAMSFGCVPIVSAGHGLEEIVGEAGCTAPVGDVEVFAAHLERLVLNPTERSERARRALDRVRETYDSKTILRRNLAVFERLAGKGRD
jgi:glycosyltransferase involved in cell wall biosynthesis